VSTDNGHEFQAKFHWHVEDKGIRHAYIKAGSPQLNGKVERSHRSDEEEFYQLLTYRDDVDLEAGNVSTTSPDLMAPSKAKRLTRPSKSGYHKPRVSRSLHCITTGQCIPVDGGYVVYLMPSLYCSGQFCMLVYTTFYAVLEMLNAPCA
jgi:transposase InsO family protein